MKKQQKKRFFNLIEVTVAIAVVGIGIAGVMALLPPAIEANRSADYNNYTGDVVSTLASYYQAELQRSWRTSTSAGDFIILLDSKPSENTLKTDLLYAPTDAWTEKKGLQGIYTVNKGGTAYFGVKTVDEGILANILVWKASDSDVPALQYHDPADTANPKTITTGEKMRVFFELSWPAARPYDSREKRLYVYEFYKR